MMPRPDLFGPDTSDPYSVYDALRAEGVTWDEQTGSWLICGYQDVERALRDPRLRCPEPSPQEPLPAVLLPVATELRLVYEFRSLAIVYLTGPAHERVRAAIRPIFSAASLVAFRPRIEAIAGGLIDRVHAAGVMDAVHDFSAPLATMSVATLLGIPPADTEWWMSRTVRAFDLAVGWPEHPEAATLARAAAAAIRELSDYLTRLAAARLRAPRHDLTSLLAAAVERGEIDPASMAANLAYVSESGRHTTAQFITIALWSLLRHPNQCAALAAEPSLVPAAVEELLRYDSGCVTVARVAEEPLAAGGATIERGERVMPLLAAANRDPAHAPTAADLDTRRPRVAHLTFGAGPHVCIGAPLARLESGVALELLLRRLPGLRLGEEPIRWAGHPGIRLPASLPLMWDAPR